MSYFKLQKERMVSGGESIREVRALTTEKVISRSFHDSPSYEKVSINNVGDIGARIVSDTKDPAIKSILMHPKDKICAGDVVKREDGSIWLCTASDPKAIYTSGFIAETNHLLRWIDEKGEIQSHPAVFYFNTRSNFGVSDDRIMTLPDGRRQTVVQKNEHTIKIKRGKRFIIGGEAFKVIDYDSASDKGLVNISFESSQIAPSRDNLELEIADYYQNVSDYSIEILNGDFASIKVDQALQLIIEVKNKGTIIENPQVALSVTDSSIAEISESGLLSPIQKGEVVVTASYEDRSAQIKISITEKTTANYTADIFGADEIVVERTAQYRCKFSNNGVAYPDESVYVLTSVDEKETNLASIVSQDPINNTCLIKAGKTVGEIKLNVRNTNGLSQGSKIIKIKPLF